MEWSTMEPFGASFILGDMEGDVYVPADDCDEVLEDMLDHLAKDDGRTAPFRRTIGMEKVLEKDLIPLIKFVKDETIFSLAIRFLANLTQPIEQPVSDQLAKDMDSLMTDAKRQCMDVNVFKAMGRCMKDLLNKVQLESPDLVCLSHCIYLLRNLLHLDHGGGSNDKDRVSITHQCLLSSFFMNEMDKVIVSMLKHKKKEVWTISIAQLISFVFKDYSSNLLEPDLDDVSNSSGEENQNMMEILMTEGAANNSRHPATASTTHTLTNTFKKNLQICSLSGGLSTTVGGCSTTSTPEDEDFMLEIKPTQDGRLEIKLANPTSLMEGDGSGGARTESPPVGASDSMKSPRGSPISHNSISNNSKGHSTGGSGGGVSQSNLSNVDVEKEVMSSINSACCLMDVDIFIAYLKKFATDIVYAGLVDLVENMMKAMLTQYETILDHSLLMWTVGFFLSFSQQQDLDLAQIKEIFNMDLLGLLVYEGVNSCESLVIKQKREEDCAAEKHRLHLVVCTLNQMFRTILANSKGKPISGYMQALHKYLSRTSDLRHLFVLLVRQHTSSVQSQTYLCDLVQTNHVLMLLIEEWLSNGILREDDNFTLLSHVNHFATSRMMAKYGSLLEQEDENRDTLNVAVLTMMYHVAGSCQRQDTLVQLPILKAFTEIWMENAVHEESKIRAKGIMATNSMYEHEFKDLIEFVLKIFMTEAGKVNSSFAENLFASAESPACEDTASMESMNTDSGLFNKELGEEEQVLILSWMADIANTEDASAIIGRRLREHGFDQNDETVRRYMEDYGFQVMGQVANAAGPADGAVAGGPVQDAGAGTEGCDETAKVLQELSVLAEEELVPYLVGKVKGEGHDSHLVWVQKQLLEAAYVKLGLQDPSYRIHVEEPVSRFYALQNKAIPLVPWSEELERALASPYFLFLQKCLGLYTNDDPNILYPRIPQYLTPLQLVDIAGRIGSIESLNMKFDASQIKADPVTMGNTSNSIGSGQPSTSATDRPPKQTREYEWLNAVQAMNQVRGQARC